MRTSAQWFSRSLNIFFEFFAYRNSIRNHLNRRFGIFLSRSLLELESIRHNTTTTTNESLSNLLECSSVFLLIEPLESNGHVQSSSWVLNAVNETEYIQIRRYRQLVLCEYHHVTVTLFSSHTTGSPIHSS